MEYNRQKNVTQDSQISTLSSQVQALLEQAPAGYLPRVYYGLTRGAQTYRFVQDNVFNVADLPGSAGDAYELYSPQEDSANYIPAIAIQINDEQIKIIIPGDYSIYSDTFIATDMRTGEQLEIELSSPVSLQDASYLGDYEAADNREKQITVLYNLQTNSRNVIFASIDINADGIYNWIEIGTFVDGKDGKNFYGVSSSTEAAIFANIKAGDSFVVVSEFTHSGTTYSGIGDVYVVNTISPLVVTLTGNIRGPQGVQGIPGQDGADGADGATPTIVDGYWYINGVSTGVKAEGKDGTDGTDGQSFQIQSGLYSTPDNWGQSGNVDPDGNALLQLPTLPQSAITSKAYVVYDPLTTPLYPFYDLYFANNGEVSWTIMHPFSGLKGQDGSNGYTPYISGGYWYINGTNTGVPATGPQGPTGPVALETVGIYSSPNAPGAYDSDYVSSFNRTPVVGEYFERYWNQTSNGETIKTYICKCQVTSVSNVSPFSVTFDIKSVMETTGATGATGQSGATGATPNISVAITELPINNSATVQRSGTNENPTITFGIPISRGIIYQTTAPGSANTDGTLKVVVLSSEPATKYAGYLYIITE